MGPARRRQNLRTEWRGGRGTDDHRSDDERRHQPHRVSALPFAQGEDHRPGRFLGHDVGRAYGEGTPGAVLGLCRYGPVVGKEEKEAYLYAAILKKVRAAHDTASLAELERIGAPPYRSQQDLLVERDVSQRYDIDSEKTLRSAMTPVVLFAPDFTLFDIYAMQRYDNFASNAMYKELIGFDVRKLGPD